MFRIVATDWVPILESSMMHCCTIPRLYTSCEARVWNALEAMLSSSNDKRQNRNPSFGLRVLASIEDQDKAKVLRMKP